jgi:hypothetical protein
VASSLLRANPAFELVAFRDLQDEERAQLGSVPDDAELFGVLRRRSGGGRLKAVGHDTATLFQALRRPRRLEELTGVPVPGPGAVERLVLGEVLEVADGDRFASGPAAAGLLSAPAREASGAAATRIGQLSLAALRYGAALELDEASALSARIYFYNRVPAGAGWHRRFPDGSAVRNFLGIDARGRNREPLDEHWDERAPEDGGGWIVWHPHGKVRGGGRFKLYVSPAPEDAGLAFDATVTTLTRLGAASTFKVGPDVYGLLRPDKLVVYFRSRAELDEMAAELAPRLADVRAHGVPFTAESAGDGILSWGVDPPARRGREWWERESWRLWITNRLATAILSARAAGSEVEPWRFALRRIEAEGVDPVTWTPLGTAAQTHGEGAAA